MSLKPTYRRFGDRGILIDWPSKIDPAINAEVLQMDAFISEGFKNEIVETVPAYHSLAVYVLEEIDVSGFIDRIKDSAVNKNNEDSNAKNVVILPVCYKGRLAPDIDEVAETHKINTSEVIRLHTDPLYKVYFLGFLPGFPYLGGLNKKLHTGRRSSPRRQVEKGSVGIGGGQTGIYTSNSPGGWNIIGRCPLDFFSLEENDICLLKPGDYIKFTSVSRKEFDRIQLKVIEGNFKIQREVRYD